MNVFLFFCQDFVPLNSYHSCLASECKGKMGGKESKEVVKSEHKQLEKDMRKEIEQISPAIKDNVLQKNIFMTENVECLRYSNLKNKEKIVKNIEQVVSSADAPHLTKFVADTATSVVTAMESTKQIKAVSRWHSSQQVANHSDKVLGMELYYRVIVLENSGVLSNDVVVMIAYKIYVHALRGHPDDFLSQTELKELTF